MPFVKPAPEDKLCPACGIRKAGAYPGDLCRHCYDIKRNAVPELSALTPKKLEKLQERLKDAEASGDWKALADGLQDTVKAIAAGTVKATAAQSSLLKHIMDRAYGRVSKTQEDKKSAVGVVVLPSFGIDATAHICPECLAAHELHKEP